MTQDFFLSVQRFNLSTHILTRRMTFSLFPLPKPDPFNSHPHKEDDRNHAFYGVLTLTFNSHPHKEDDGVHGV